MFTLRGRALARIADHDDHIGPPNCGPRSFDAYGAMLSMSRVSHEWLVYGVVPDHVRGVRVDGRDAVLANNTFLARVPHHPSE